VPGKQRESSVGMEFCNILRTLQKSSVKVSHNTLFFCAAMFYATPVS